MFAAAPGTWIAICAIYVLVPVALLAAGSLGGLASAFLTPILSAGVFLAARAQDQGAGPRFEQLFGGFDRRWVKRLAVLGVADVVMTYAMTWLVTAAVVALVGEDSMRIFSSTDAIDFNSFDFGSINFTALVLTVLVATPLLAIGLFLIAMAFWYTPGLVIVNGVAPLAALALSFRACMRNVGAALVYSLLGVLYLILASLPLGLGWIVLGPVMAGSWYATWRDVFGEPGASP